MILFYLFVLVFAVKASEYNDPTFIPLSLKPTFDVFKSDDCPPCFNCMLPGFECLHFANCSEYDGKCNCPPGFGGDDCKQPLCGALPDGHNRSPRENDHCDCPEGWEGINCNVCKTDDVCNSLVPTGQNGTCYRDGVTVFENYQMCNVTIIL
ncbi:uncharacterized protein EV154DRAFT_257931 [Mucor mucedo]|uniref:uncharacterized protein n=1 Tax=Mucor mucedo TaxID=29922 RepID=UPI002220EE22|nr:uncharacterized protein EV154DRAFT_257931 [Mucor mucedo]KAI7896192.1 hypothetical protein EV154DRAFT_257931 [Mucor mucedo]